MSDNPSVAQPASGTYGEKAAITSLKKQLPVGAVGNPPPPAPAPPVSPEPVAQPVPAPVGRPAGPTLPPNVPAALAAPTTRPGVPVSTPLAAPAPPPPADPQQARIVLLDQLANSPDVSDDTREWAKTVLSILLDHD